MLNDKIIIAYISEVKLKDWRLTFRTRCVYLGRRHVTVEPLGLIAYAYTLQIAYELYYIFLHISIYLMYMIQNVLFNTAILYNIYSLHCYDLLF